MSDSRVIAMEMMLDAEAECSEHRSVRDSGCGECIGAEAVDMFCAVALEVLRADDPVAAVWRKRDEGNA